mmetsp:Transcript_9598/g.9245  ORF Transcript_9598/g.9245 Transcript_9598/m.9245 type:complete len:110 (-) Transcript_9598:22-351(-)
MVGTAVRVGEYVIGLGADDGIVDPDGAEEANTVGRAVVGFRVGLSVAASIRRRTRLVMLRIIFEKCSRQMWKVWQTMSNQGSMKSKINQIMSLNLLIRCCPRLQNPRVS